MQKSTLFYIYDGLCGWCFGFSPVIKKIAADFSNKLNLEVLSGGMVTGPRIGPIKEMASYIRQAAPRVTEITGETFGDAYLNDVLSSDSIISNSLPPAIALAILKEKAPDKQVHFAHSIQNLMFREGKDLNQPETYLDLAWEAEISESDFKKRFKDKKYQTGAEKEFELVQNWGITGFPAVVLEKENKLYLLAQGYQPYETLAQTITDILAGNVENKAGA